MEHHINIINGNWQYLFENDYNIDYNKLANIILDPKNIKKYYIKENMDKLKIFKLYVNNLISISYSNDFLIKLFKNVNVEKINPKYKYIYYDFKDKIVQIDLENVKKDIKNNIIDVNEYIITYYNNYIFKDHLFMNYAVDMEDIELCKLLIEKDYHINNITEDENILGYIFRNISKKKLEIAKYIISNTNINVNRKDTICSNCIDNLIKEQIQDYGYWSLGSEIELDKQTLLKMIDYLLETKKYKKYVHNSD